MPKDGYRVEKWLRHQRDSFKARTLSVERTEKLAAIGMGFFKEDPWEHKFNLARTYIRYKGHGNLNMKSNYMVEGVWLAKWLAEQVARLNRKVISKSETTKALPPVQVKKLETIGIRRE